MEKQWENKVQGLQAEITDHKHHLDQFKQQRTSLEREITKLKDELGDMEKMHFASSSLEEKRDKLLEKIEETELSTKRGQKLYQNYMSVYLMCQRHPAHAQALIEELENKLRLDTQFIGQCRTSLRPRLNCTPQNNTILSAFDPSAQERSRTSTFYLNNPCL